MNWTFAVSSVYQENFFKLFYLPSRSNRKNSSSCNLCSVFDNELILRELKSGYITFNRYPEFPRSLLYITKSHSKLLKTDFLSDILLFVRQYNYIACVNQYGYASNPMHLHCDLIPLKNDYLVNMNSILLILSDFGAYKLEVSGDYILEHVEFLLAHRYKFNFILVNNYAIFHLLNFNIPDEFTISARSLLGSFATSDFDKYEHIKKYGLENMLKDSSLKISFPHSSTQA